MDKLPRVIATSVVRSAHQGESHGGVYLIDLNSGQYDQVIDWNDESINWEGRGGDRGLRGIAFHNNDTGSNRLVIADRRNRIKQSCDVPKYKPSTLSNALLPNDHARQGFARGSVYMATMWLSAVHPHPPFPPTAWPQEGGLAALIFQKISATAFTASRCGQDKSHAIMRTFSGDLRVADFS
jgi:hypothetical protein